MDHLDLYKEETYRCLLYTSSFDCLEQCTATGRNVRNAVCQTEFVDASYRVATAYE